MKTRLLSFSLVLCLCLCLLPLGARATDTSVYLALGDSITRGYAPADIHPSGAVERPFAVQVAAQEHAVLNNLAADGETTATLLSKLRDDTSAVSQAVLDADLITLTIGGNDLINALYAYLSEQYALAHQGDDTSFADIRAALSTGTVDTGTLLALAGYLERFPESSQATAALDTVQNNLTEILTEIQRKNATATVLIATQYHPYGHITNSLLADIVDTFQQTVSALNTRITAAAQAAHIIVADIYTALEAATENPCNAYVQALYPTADLSLDFHPNQTGHDLIAEAICDALANRPLPFADVKTTDWFYPAVTYVYQNGLMQGASDQRFAPNDVTSRAMLVTILWRLDGQPQAGRPLPFADVDNNSYCAEAIRWAASEGVVTGTTATVFEPNSPVTREQFAAILYRYARTNGQGFTGAWAFRLDYPDADEVSEYAYEAMCWMTMRNVIGGTDGGLLSPRSNATRAETAAMLMRFAAI